MTTRFPRHLLRALLPACLLAMLIAAGAAAAGPQAGAARQASAPAAPVASVAMPAADLCDIRTAQRVVAVADVHGASLAFINILRAAGLIDADRRWSGGDAILVQTGDVLDRGPDSRGVLDLLMRLEREAARAGGRVIALLGNHEVMRMMRDLRYVSAAEYAAFRSPQADQYRELYYQAVLKRERGRAEAAGQPFDEAALRPRFLDQFPLGFVEMQVAFEPAGDYGRWLRGQGAMAQINDIAFGHAGIHANVAGLGCKGINERVRAELADPPEVDDPASARTLIAGPEGPLWYRGLVDAASTFGDTDIAALLERFGAKVLVVGHTPTADHRVRTLYGDRIVQLDTGMLGGTFYPGGRPAALEIHNGTVTAIYTDRRDVLFSVPPSAR
jgi:hypothetical protein